MAGINSPALAEETAQTEAQLASAFAPRIIVEAEPESAVAESAPEKSKGWVRYGPKGTELGSRDGVFSGVLNFRSFQLTIPLGASHGFRL